MKKNGFLTFCFSFVPGAGQMYQKYMKRGLSIMIIFAGFLMLAILLNSAIFVIPSLIIMAYSFFDTFNIRNTVGTQEQYVDEYVWTNKEMPQGLSEIFNKRSYLIGISLVLIGIYLILNNVMYSLASQFDIYWLERIIRLITRYFPHILISVLSIGIGTKMIIGKKG